ncbi:hypothetical protein Glove_79g107 [Diversispora epigaea]|uniref:G-protein coupled receptors family 1 profile domain-containing protein n=1 Tax=Diversispora epigaea TaxID=1348612 RepID=A0A397JAT0_9GLOM|nr:hypothetical protein Glove_79g107 [Diversispora epigaea]
MGLTTYQVDAFVCFLAGTVSMIALHNLIISIILYKARKANVSNISKIILNLNIMILFIFRIAAENQSTFVDLIGCQIVIYIQYIATFFYRTALAFFLLWRLRQVGNSKLDKWASIILLSTRTIVHLTTFGFIKVFVRTTSTRNYCWIDQKKLKIAEPISLCIDFLIDIYITVRLVNVLRVANKNAAGLRSSANKRTKRTLFTAVMYWNFVRLAVAFGLNSMAAANLIFRNFHPYPTNDQYATIAFFQILCFILLSYVVTVDAEIVKVIEGGNKNNKKSSKSTSKSTSEKSSYFSSSMNRATFKNNDSLSLPKYNIPNIPTSPPQSDSNESKKRLSFFEWTNIVLGFRHEKNLAQEFTEEEFDEIIGGSSVEATNDPNRISNISGGSTIVATTNDITDV